MGWQDAPVVNAGTPKWASAPVVQPSPGMGETAYDHALQGASMGFGDELYGTGKAIGNTVANALGIEKHPESFGDLYRQNRDAYRGQLAAERKANPATATVAEIGGGLAPILLPGVGAAKGLAGAAKTGAALGATSGMGNSNADLPKGELAHPAMDTGKGAAFGGGAGVLGYKAGEAISGPLADYLRGLSQRQAIRALGPTAGDVRNLMGRSGESAESIAQRLGVDAETAASLGGKDKLRELADYLVENKLLRPGDKLKDVVDRLGQAKQAANTDITTAVNHLDATGAKVDTADLSGRFRALFEEGKRAGPGGLKLTKKFGDAAKEVERNPESALSFDQARDWKHSYQAPVNFAKLNPSAAQQGDKELAGAAKQWLDEAAQGVGGDAAKAFQQANRDYHLTAAGSSIAQGGLGRANARAMTSPTEKALGIAGLLGTFASGSVLPVAVGAGLGAIKKGSREYGPAAIAVGARAGSDALRKLTESAPHFLGQYGPVLVNALRASPEEFAAKSYVLSQTDPGFQALQKQIGEPP